MMTWHDLRRWLETAPAGTKLDAQAVRDVLDRLEDTDARPKLHAIDPTPPPEPSWREKLWMAPAETRIGRPELLEAVGKSESWLYRHTASKRPPGRPRIPHRKLDGELVFVVGEIRAWLRDHEEVIEAGPMESTPEERRRAMKAA